MTVQFATGVVLAILQYSTCEKEVKEAAVDVRGESCCSATLRHTSASAPRASQTRMCQVQGQWTVSFQ